MYLKPRSHRTNGAVAFLELWKCSSPLVTIQQTLATVKETPYTHGQRLWSLLPLRTFFTAQNIANGKKGPIFCSGKVHRRSYTAKSPLDASSWTLGSTRPTPKSHSDLQRKDSPSSAGPEQDTCLSSARLLNQWKLGCAFLHHLERPLLTADLRL